MGDLIKWMLITADPEIARYAEESGVHRIFIDMEVKGKAKRQGHLDTHKASHTPDDISSVRRALTTAELMVRINPLHDGTEEEIRTALNRGADRLMLPMFTTADDVAQFRQLVPNPTPITFLAETPQALVRIGTWLRYLCEGDEVHFGLNDLSLAMGLDFLFEPLAGNLLDGAAARLREADIPFGVGGVARAGGGDLPARSVLGEHVRLGSGWVILSRAFHGSAATLEELRSELDLAVELARLREIEDAWKAATPAELQQNLDHLCACSDRIAEARRRSA